MRARTAAAAPWVALLVVLAAHVALAATGQHQTAKERIDPALVQSWADKFGGELWYFGEYVSRRKEVQDSFKTAQIETRDGNKLVDEMSFEIRNMMELKKDAVRRIMETAEKAAESFQYHTVEQNYTYINSKSLLLPDEPPINATASPGSEDEDEIKRPPYKQMDLAPHAHFNGTLVNTTYSSVHIPTNVYDWAPNVIHAIRWSEELDLIFANNYQSDPTLSWQYFGSSTGFMRHFPGRAWRVEPVDLFDCRTRAWYIEAANSPKDIVILVDSSGSMTGQRKDIAKHVVSNILDTLGNNDFVSVYRFNDTVEAIVECFNGTLVQATMDNVRELKLGMESIDTLGIANFSKALLTAFDILRTYREDEDRPGKPGARCNQAIMLVTDGVPYNYKEIFEHHNWQDKKNMSARVFTYLIGKEVPDVREVQWMACANMGFYVHLSTLAEVREQVLQYISVMARPLVLWDDVHPIIWTSVYADSTVSKKMDYLWEELECEEQRNRFLSYQQNMDLFLSEAEQLKRSILKRRKEEDQHSGSNDYELMTSISMPVFDKTENMTRVANLLGVAGTDVPIKDIQALMMPYQLGVNGYAFMVSNNGYILVHPDLRPFFQGILKPSYNSVDMIEVELMDDDRGPRDFPSELIQFRSDIVNQRNGSLWMQVKYHYDNLKRVSRIRRQYFWRGIPDSPFTLVVALPEPYGLHRLTLRPDDDIHRTRVNGDNVTNYFQGDRWRIHPDWLYCRHKGMNFTDPKDELMFFLRRMSLNSNRWAWPLKPRPPDHGIHSNTSSGKSEPKMDYFCDRSLMQAVVFDARVTNWFSQNITSQKDEKGKELVKRFGITVAFMATHSGLTRWQTFKSEDSEDAARFGDYHNRAIDEIWYRRAVEQHYMEPQSFVYSVPFDSGETIVDGYAGPLVTATHAVFHTVDQHSAPAAVVGFQFQFTSLHTYFTNITSACGDFPGCIPCKSDELDCFVIDNNGYILVSKNIKEAGKFFGEVNPKVMSQLVDDKVYRQITLTDYQAVCFKETATNNPATNLISPFRYLWRLLEYLLAYVLWIWQHLSVMEIDAYSFPSDEDTYDMGPDSPGGGGFSKVPPSKAKEKEVDKQVLIKRTLPTPCNQEVKLFQLQQYPDKGHSSYKNISRECTKTRVPYIVRLVPGSNLLLVVVDMLCPQHGDPPDIAPIPVEVVYENSNGSLACAKSFPANMLTRRRLEYCIRHHPNESEIKLCGHGTRVSGSYVIHTIFASLLTILSSYMLLPSKAS